MLRVSITYGRLVAFNKAMHACVGCLFLLTLPTNCSIFQYFLLYINVILEGQFFSTFVRFDIFHGDEVEKRSRT